MANNTEDVRLREKIAKVMQDYGVDFYEGNLMHREEQRLSLISDMQDDLLTVAQQEANRQKAEMLDRLGQQRQLCNDCVHDNDELETVQFIPLSAIEADRKKQIEQAYSDGFMKASKGAFKSQQAAKREAVEELLDRLEATKRTADLCTDDTYVVKQKFIEAERNKLKESK